MLPCTATPLIVDVYACRGGASANMSDCTFPYCNCITSYPSECLVTTVPTVSGNTASFTVSSSCPAPLYKGCSQNLAKIEINTCEHTAIDILHRHPLHSLYLMFTCTHAPMKICNSDASSFPLSQLHHADGPSSVPATRRAQRLSPSPLTLTGLSGTAAEVPRPPSLS